ncbi:hypothetical protein EI94DRAFT_1826342 [Lactarius quietus]|nr:hypothetical protein EI94DRAFT_1826342 [Lactarius quietus]
MNPFSPSFDALEFPTSPLPPSSPLPSSTTLGSLLPLCQAPHANEEMPLDFVTTPARSSCGADSPSSSYLRFMTPDSAAEAVAMRCLPHSHRTHEISTHVFIPSYSKADLIPELLMWANPWNAIGDMLDLPPIPTANETYFNEITPQRTISHGRVSPLASLSSTGRPHRVVPSSLAQIEDTRLQAAPPNDDLDSTAETMINLKGQSSGERYFSSSGQGDPIHLGLAGASPGGSNRTLDWNKFSACVAAETPPRLATPQRSLLLPQLQMISVLSSPDSMHWNTISDVDLDALIPKTPSTKTTMARVQGSRPVYDIFRYKQDDVKRMS